MRVKVTYIGTVPPMQCEFPVLWVHWYGYCNEDELGWENSWLPQISFMDDTDEDWPAYGFVDPQDVISTVHLIPSFVYDDETRPGVGVNPFLTKPRLSVVDYDEYYVNWYVCIVKPTPCILTIKLLVGLLIVTCSCAFVGEVLDILI